MPDTATHDIITVVTAAVVVPLAWTLMPSHELGAALIVGGSHVISGLIFSPDLDVDSREYQRWGPLRFIWWPYKELIHHRNWLSHGLVVGPLFRLAYFTTAAYLLLWIMLLVSAPFAGTNPTDVLADVRLSARQLVEEQRPLIIAFLVGFISGGAAHTIPDWLQTRTKIQLREWGLRRPRRRRREG